MFQHYLNIQLSWFIAVVGTHVPGEHGEGEWSAGPVFPWYYLDCGDTYLL